MFTQLPAGSFAAARRVTGSCRDFTLDGVKFRVVCRGNLEIGLVSDTQVGIDNISFRIKTTYFKNTKNLFIHIALIPLGDLLEIFTTF